MVKNSTIKPIVAHLRYLHIAPRKVRLVAKPLQGLAAISAETQLNFLQKRAKEPLKKLLKSALANAQHNFKIPKENLRIAQILVNEGPAFRRVNPRARGRANIIRKKTSHVSLVLEPITPQVKTVKREKRLKSIPKEAGKPTYEPESLRKAKPQPKPRQEAELPKYIGRGRLREMGRRFFRRKAI